MDFIVLLQLLPGESFCLRQCQIPAVQKSRSEGAVKALDKWILPGTSRIDIVDANSMVQEQFFTWRTTNSLPLSLAGNPALSKRGAASPAS